MQIEQLDLDTRSKIYNYTKKVLRKYQKGIISGKLTADKFADNILSNEDIYNIIDPNILKESDFKTSYINYIDKLIDIQNDSLPSYKKGKKRSMPQKPSITQKIKLKNLLIDYECSLNIPYEYLNYDDVECIIQYITTGTINLGDERIYNYVNKPIKH